MAKKGVDWFQPAQGGKTFGVANLTNDPTVRDWANYHNCNCWSPDGRYVCYTRFASNGRIYGDKKAAEVHLFDLHSATDRKVDNGLSPRWANDHNWLFYIRYVEGAPEAERSEVWWLNVAAGRKVLMGRGMTQLGTTSFDDTWLFGSISAKESGSGPKSFRMRICEDSSPERLPGADHGAQWIANPCHNVVFARVPNRDEEPFYPTRYWFDLDGKNIRIGAVTLERCHQSWLGNGEYYLMGNSLVRGRKWNQPFPGSIHFLANVTTGDVSPCGRSGRFVVGDHPLTLADLRSGDGWTFLEDLTIICYPTEVKDDSGPFDADIKGSPDGTKVCFVSNYDLRDGPVTFITKDGSEADDRIEVESTEMFPDSGEIVVLREVIRYERKTPTSFEGLERKRHGTGGVILQKYSPIRAGMPVTSFEARCIPQEEWQALPQPARNVQKSIGGLDSPLIRQRSTDVYLAVVRKPDRPYLRKTDGGVELIPGECHGETRGYVLLRAGQRLNDEPLPPGAAFDIVQGGDLTAVAVEWCGLESSECRPLAVKDGTTVHVLADPPADFSWTRDGWTVAGEEVDVTAALQSEEAVREVRHLYDGVIARAWYNWGTITRRHDLNADGKATRRLLYHQGALFRRQYYTPDDQLLTTEYLDPEGNVTEMIRYDVVGGRNVEKDHWWHDKGMPVRRICAGGVGRQQSGTGKAISSNEPLMFLKSGDRWVLQDYVGRRLTDAELEAEERKREHWGKEG